MGVTNKDPSREAFEKWFIQDRRSRFFALQAWSDEELLLVLLPDTSREWDVWKAARSAPAAPVELPEPFALYDGEKWYANEKAAICSCANMQKLQKVYTEQQVRELLSQAGTVVAETPESPPKSAETRMDTGADRGGGMLPEPAIDLPRAGAEALKEYFQFCKEQSILPDVGGAFAYAIRAGAKIAAAPKLPQGDGWLPIESAPRDGTLIVVHGNNFNDSALGQHCCIAAWCRGCWMESSEWRAPSELEYLTHWMPLPQPPQEQV